MTQKGILITHEWELQYLNNRDYTMTAYINFFKSSRIPGVIFNIFCAISGPDTCVVVLSKTPCASANATIKIEMFDTDKKQQQLHFDHWINNYTFTFKYNTIQSTDYYESRKRIPKLKFVCDITWRGYPKPSVKNNLHSHLKNFLTMPDLSDMTIVIGEEEIPVHKIILAAYSPVFLTMFKTDMTESVNKQIVVRDIEVDIMKQVLEFMYIGVIDPVPEFDVFLSILEVADKYEISVLKKLCEQELSKQITIENALEILEGANLYGVPQLIETLISFMVENKLSIIALEEFADVHNRKPDLLYEFVIRSIAVTGKF